LHVASAATERTMILYHHSTQSDYQCTLTSKTHCVHDLCASRDPSSLLTTHHASSPPIPQPNHRQPATAPGSASPLRKGCSLRRHHHQQPNHGLSSPRCAPPHHSRPSTYPTQVRRKSGARCSGTNGVQNRAGGIPSSLVHVAHTHRYSQ
jgi:hypothetical protein